MVCGGESVFSSARFLLEPGSRTSECDGKLLGCPCYIFGWLCSRGGENRSPVPPLLGLRWFTFKCLQSTEAAFNTPGSTRQRMNALAQVARPPSWVQKRHPELQAPSARALAWSPNSHILTQLKELLNKTVKVVFCCWVFCLFVCLFLFLLFSCADWVCHSIMKFNRRENFYLSYFIQSLFFIPFE